MRPSLACFLHGQTCLCCLFTSTPRLPVEQFVPDRRTSIFFCFLHATSPGTSSRRQITTDQTRSWAGSSAYSDAHINIPSFVSLSSSVIAAQSNMTTRATTWDTFSRSMFQRSSTYTGGGQGRVHKRPTIAKNAQGHRIHCQIKGKRYGSDATPAFQLQQPPAAPVLGAELTLTLPAAAAGDACVTAAVSMSRVLTSRAKLKKASSTLALDLADVSM